MPWLDGVAHSMNTVPFDVTDRGLLLGDGVFDTALVLGGRMVWRAAHVARLLAACRTLGFAPEPSRVEAAIEACLSDATRGSMRVTITRGPGPRGLRPPADPIPSVLASLGPLRTDGVFAPLRLHVSAIRRNDTSPTARLKTLGYLDGVLATREALTTGCDDALFLNTAGRVACAATGNVVAMLGDRLVTPPLDEGVLNGITRAVILATCRAIGLEPIERPLLLDELCRADAVCVTNSLRLVSPVTAIGDEAIDSAANPRCLALIAHVADLVRVECGDDVRRPPES